MAFLAFKVAFKVNDDLEFEIGGLCSLCKPILSYLYSCFGHFWHNSEINSQKIATCRPAAAGKHWLDLGEKLMLPNIWPITPQVKEHQNRCRAAKTSGLVPWFALFAAETEVDSIVIFCTYRSRTTLVSR